MIGRWLCGDVPVRRFVCIVFLVGTLIQVLGRFGVPLAILLLLYLAMVTTPVCAAVWAVTHRRETR